MVIRSTGLHFITCTLAFPIRSDQSLNFKTRGTEKSLYCEGISSFLCPDEDIWYRNTKTPPHIHLWMTTYPFKHTRSLSTTHTHTSLVALETCRRFWGEIPLNMKPSENTEDNWRETFHENQHNGKPLRHIGTSDFKLTSFPVSYRVPPSHHLEERHPQSRSCTHTLHRSRESICTWPRHLWAYRGERPVSPCLVCSSGLSECDKTHEGLRSNWGDLQCHDRFTTLLLQAYIQWNIYSVSVTVIYCRQN